MKHFCSVPWFQQDLYSSADFNPESFCCWAQSAVKGEPLSREAVQKKFLNNERPAECRKCWLAEDSNTESRRQMENGFFDFRLDTDIDKLDTLITNGQSEIISYQIRISNTCNGACVTCDSESSSTWAKYEKKMGIVPSPSLTHSEEVLSAINFRTVKSIRLTGGEPLLSDSTYWLLSQLVSNNNTDCFIGIITNGSIKVSKKYKNILSKFKNLNICLSIDGIEKEFEYLRFPMKWNTLLENIQKYRELTDDINVSYTVSNMNVDSASTIKWFNDQGLSYIINRVRKPAHFAPDVQPGHELWEKCIAVINLQDKVKGIQIKDYIPKFWEKMND